MRTNGRAKRQGKIRRAHTLARQYALQIGLWLAWALAVAATAWGQWYQDHAQHLPLNMPVLVIHCLFVGVLGIVMITNIEIWLDPDE